ncbi:MAG: hypothetical protein IKV32_00575 [Muribaculaceae bacterium]|nr:hypothetical protein [Muribaculaceae bacterium]
MIKRIFICLAILVPFLSSAQIPVGEWNVYSVFTDVTKMLQTPDKVYYLSGSNLYSYDKKYQETYNYTTLNKLSDKVIDNIYYNREGKYLLITYKSGNIDLLYDDGSVVNLPDIMNSTLNYSLEINDVAFMGNEIYVATKFGLVAFNESRQEVKFSGVYNKEISLVTTVGEYVVVDQNHALYLIHKDDRFETFDDYKQVSSGWWFGSLEGISENKVVAQTTDKKIYVLDFNFDKKNYKRIDISTNTKNSSVIYGKEDFYYVENNVIYTISPEAVKTAHNTLPSEISSQTISIWNNPNEIWAGNKDGIANYKLNEGGSVTVLQDKFHPSAISVDHPFFITNDINGKIYISNKSESVIYELGYKKQAFISTIDNGELKDITPTEFTASHNSNPSKNVLYDIYQLTVDPEDPEIYYLGSHWEGMYKVKDGKTIAQYNPETSSLLESWGCRVNAISFDKENNLWCTCEVLKAGDACLHILPAEARKKESTTPKDWIPISLGDFQALKDVQILICKKSNMIFLTDGKWGPSVVAYDTKGTYTDTSDDNYVLWNSFIDQDGKSYTFNRVGSIIEDKDGKVWIGTSNGIVEITNPKNATSSSMTVNRLKVPRNDGTNYADYLLDAIQVTSISVDHSNRKWVGTMSDGVYLVSELGNEVLEHFTPENSYHPGGITYSVFANPFNNSVFVGTEFGLVEYGANSSPSQGDYSEIYAYPNPVNPDYTGDIVIKGLMENSLVKIADSAGNVFYTTRSEGGMVTWNGCNSAGERVKSGVYFVFVSQKENEQTSGAITKIMIIN